ncbi:FecR domain-containing protein [Aeoliella mucimassa]|uniref:FecR protein n=1 Tax=Aeoliella mucimassa TaxID=2527972 RepID=A0A518AUI7_9BACT|nr:FecR domain-containing protein [Aeoliella mucimassa]QDU58386.1 FecR protein [Aeoliella mucimassa]
MDVSKDQLINKLIEQQADPADIEALQEWLQNDPEAVEKYLQLMQVHADLAESLAPVRAFSVEELRAMQAIDEKFDQHVRPSDEYQTPGSDGVYVHATPGSVEKARKASHRSNVLAWSIAVASLATMLAFVLIPQQPPVRTVDTSQGVTASPVVANTPADSVATVIRKVDCDWEVDRWSTSSSAAIHAGQQINLSRGMLVLQFNSGPIVTLSGRTAFVATSDKSGQLIQGSLSARVPEQGRGFRIETHAGDFIDLGTEFGMIISEDGSVETHVFEGQVRAEPTSTKSKAAEHVLLNKGQAWTRLEPGGVDVEGVSDPQRFMRTLANQGTRDTSAIPVTDQLVLWFDASQAIQCDPAGRAYAWGNLAPAAGDKAIDAWQVEASKRPRWLADRMNGHPSLKFTGNEGMVTEPLTLGSSSTSVVVFRLDSQAAIDHIRSRKEYRHLGVQLLNLNGPPHTVLQVNQNLTLESRVHRGFLKDQLDPVDVGTIRTMQPLDNGVHVVTYAYDAEASQATLWLDGETVAVSHDAPKLQSTSAPRFLGAHFERQGFGFTGLISEFVVFDKPLANSDVLGIHQWLSEKYRSPPKGKNIASSD